MERSGLRARDRTAIARSSQASDAFREQVLRPLKADRNGNDATESNATGRAHDHRPSAAFPPMFGLSMERRNEADRVRRHGQALLESLSAAGSAGRSGADDLRSACRLRHVHHRLGGGGGRDRVGAVHDGGDRHRVSILDDDRHRSRPQHRDVSRARGVDRRVLDSGLAARTLISA